MSFLKNYPAKTVYGLKFINNLEAVLKSKEPQK